MQFLPTAQHQIGFFMDVCLGGFLLLAVFALYTWPTILVTLANQIRSCFR